jgi:hypothetical protein
MATARAKGVPVALDAQREQGEDDLVEVILVHTGEDPPDSYDASIFLSGPTPRRAGVPSWRSEAIAELRRQWRRGRLVVFVPEPRRGEPWPSYAINRSWQLFWGDRADAVLVWISRGPGMPGHTTNDEFGRWKDSGRVVLGTPPGAEHVRYQRDYAAEAGIPLAGDLAATVTLALDRIGGGAHRHGGQRHVPLLVWHTSSFQNWLIAQERAGNELRAGRLEWTFRVGPRRDTVFFWVFHAVVWIGAEGREKTNEVVFSRPDITAIVAFHRAVELVDTEVVIVREFRSPAATVDGFVRELPGGSAFSPSSSVEHVVAEFEQVVAEFTEETGIEIAPERVRAHQSRQAAATLSSHRNHVFTLELTREEMDRARADVGTHGVLADTERTYVEVYRYGDLLRSTLVDWATLGAVTSALLAPPATTISVGAQMPQETRT